MSKHAATVGQTGMGAWVSAQDLNRVRGMGAVCCMTCPACVMSVCMKATSKRQHSCWAAQQRSHVTHEASSSMQLSSSALCSYRATCPFSHGCLVAVLATGPCTATPCKCSAAHAVLASCCVAHVHILQVFQMWGATLLLVFMGALVRLYRSRSHCTPVGYHAPHRQRSRSRPSGLERLGSRLAAAASALLATPTKLVSALG